MILAFGLLSQGSFLAEASRKETAHTVAFKNHWLITGRSYGAFRIVSKKGDRGLIRAREMLFN